MPVSKKRKTKKNRPQHKRGNPRKKIEEIVSVLDLLDDAEEKLLAEEKEAVPADLDAVVSALAKRFGRIPTEAEVYGFLMGSPEERQSIWNFGLPQTIRSTDGKEGS